MSMNRGKDTEPSHQKETQNKKKVLVWVVVAVWVVIAAVIGVIAYSLLTSESEPVDRVTSEVIIDSTKDLLVENSTAGESQESQAEQEERSGGKQ